MHNKLSSAYQQASKSSPDLCNMKKSPDPRYETALHHLLPSSPHHASRSHGRFQRLTMYGLMALLLYSFVASTIRTSQCNNLQLQSSREAVASTVTKQTVVYTPPNYLAGSTQRTLLLVSYVFGESAMRKHYLRMFVESSRTSGADVVLVGDTPPDFGPLPPNVRHILLTWEDFINRAEQFLRIDLTLVKTKATPYKVIDFKPLFAALFPELVAPYAFWGHTDNDMILGDLHRILTPEFLDTADVISGLSTKGEKVTHGPFTLYRNTPIINTLFLQGTDLNFVFGRPKPRFFDEWGQHQPSPPNRYSMTHIFHASSARLGLRRKSLPAHMVWDGKCVWNNNQTIKGVDQTSCAFCVYVNGSVVTGPNLDEHPSFCHFEKRKSTLEASLVNETFMEELIAAGSFRVDQLHGFTRFP